MTSRKKSAGLLCVSHVYPVKQKVLLNVSCADYGDVAKNVIFVPMSEKYANAVCAGPW